MPPEERRCARRYVCTHMDTNARVSALPEVEDSHDRVGTLTLVCPGIILKKSKSLWWVTYVIDLSLTLRRRLLLKLGGQHTGACVIVILYAASTCVSHPSVKSRNDSKPDSKPADAAQGDCCMRQKPEGWGVLEFSLGSPLQGLRVLCPLAASQLGPIQCSPRWKIPEAVGPGLQPCVALVLWDSTLWGTASPDTGNTWPTVSFSFSPQLPRTF